MLVKSIFCVILLLNLVSIVEAQSIKSVPHFSAEELAYISEHDTIRYVADPNWLPIEMINEKGEHIGIGADFIQLIQEKTPLNFKLMPTKTWVESVEKVKSVEVDLISLLSETDERKTYLNFTIPIFEVQSVLVTLQNQPLFTDLGEIGSNPIGIIKGYSHVELLKKDNSNLRIIELESYDQGLEMVQRGELYGVVGNMAAIGYAIQKLRMNNVKIAGNIAEDIVLRFGVPKNNPILIDILNKALLSISEREKQQIINQWLSVRYDHKTDYSIVMKSVSGVLIVLSLVLLLFLHQRRLNKKLNSANAQLEALNKQKNYLLSIIGHDLRNPFMTIMGYSSHIVEESQHLSEKELVQYASKINVKSEQVLDILNQVLDWSRLELNQINVTRELVDLRELVDKSIQFYDFITQEKAITITNNIPVATIIETDDKMLGTIIRNCIHNSIKYSNKNGTIEINYLSENGIQIKDYGIGMTPERLDMVMNRNAPYSVSGTQNETGTGLGILICREFAEHLGASFTIDSVYGTGTVFQLIL
ncbi:transporter substrate-binding domain-containing protein [bacterium]|nr:MAG: transporter substrate-binding domain-containing protein [bacterium]